MTSRYRLLRMLVVALLAVGVVPADATSSAGEDAKRKTRVSSKVKVGKGVISDVALARNPDRGDLLVVYEAEGRIYATVMRERRRGKYKGRKARLISSRKRTHHRPAAIWDPVRGSWAVAWDTGPADPAAAWVAHTSGSETLEPSQIHVRELRARNGKPRGPAVVIDNGMLNLGPQFMLLDETGEARDSEPATVLETHTIADLQRLMQEGKLSAVELVDLYLDRLDRIDVTGIPMTGGDVLLHGRPAPIRGGRSSFFIPLQRFNGSGNGTATFVEFDPLGGTVTPGNPTPAQFPGVHTTGPEIASPPVPDTLEERRAFFVWEEREAVFREGMARDNGPILPPPAPAPQDSSFPVRHYNLPAVPPGDPATFADAGLHDRTGFQPRRGAPAEGRLYRLDESGTFGEGQLLFRSRKGILDAEALVGGEDDPAIVLWAEVRNKKRSKLWLESVELEDE